MAIDYKSFSYNGEGGQESKIGEINKQWWKASKTELPANVAGILKFLQEHQGARITQQLVSARLYGNLAMMGINGLTYSKMASVQNGLRDRVSYNVVQSCVDTVTSKMAKNKPKPFFLTSGGEWKIQRKAKKLNEFVDGIFYDNKAYDLGSRIFVDACVFGDGVVKVFNDNNRVKFERVLSGELYVDEMEAFYGKPRSIHQVKFVDRDILLECYPGHASDINEANSAKADEAAFQPSVADTVAVVESWHLPSGPDATDGVHSLVIANCTLLKEKYTKSHFPFAFLKWTPRLYGFWGQGLVEQIQNLQLEINKLLWVIQRSMHLAGSFKVLLENGSKLVKEHFNNDIGALIMYSGQKPEYIVPPIVPPEIYAHLQTLKGAAFEQAGISQLSAASKKPEGLDSGKALREFNDIESERFLTVGRAYESFFLELAHLAIDCAKDIAEETGNYEVKVPGKKFLKTINWDEVDLKDDEYVMKMFPVSSLPQEPAGRLQTIQEYAQAGYISPRTARRLIDFPDLEATEDLYNSTEDYLHSIMEKIVDDGEYTPPEPFDDLQLARELALEYYAYGKNCNLEEDRLELIRTFISQLDLLGQEASAPTNPPGAGSPPAPGGSVPGAAPQAAPMPPPQSDLLQNSPQG